MNEALYQKIRCHESLCQTKLSISFFNIISIIYSTYMKMGNMTCLKYPMKVFLKDLLIERKVYLMLQFTYISFLSLE